jgi:hypothetical protein
MGSQEGEIKGKGAGALEVNEGTSYHKVKK